MVQHLAGFVQHLKKVGSAFKFTPLRFRIKVKTFWLGAQRRTRVYPILSTYEAPAFST
jgi:hypothetical protein